MNPEGPEQDSHHYVELEWPLAGHGQGDTMSVTLA